MGGNLAGELVTGKNKCLEAPAEAERGRKVSGEGKRRKLEADEAVFLVVPAGDAGELADGGSRGVREGPAGECAGGVRKGGFHTFQALNVVVEGEGERRQEK